MEAGLPARASVEREVLFPGSGAAFRAIGQPTAIRRGFMAGKPKRTTNSRDSSDGALVIGGEEIDRDRVRANRESCSLSDLSVSC